MTYNDFIIELQELTLPAEFPYLPSSTSGQNSYTLLNVSKDEIKVERDDKEISISISQIKKILENIEDNKPLDVEATLGGSGNARSIVESLLCLSPHFFYTRIQNRKHIVYMPNQKHDLGKLTFIEEREVKRIAREEIEKEFQSYLENVISKKSGNHLTSTAISSYMIFTDVSKLFDYNPEKWKHVESLFDITSLDEFSKILREVRMDRDFVSRNRNDNNGWRLGTLNKYFQFLKKRVIPSLPEDDMDDLPDELNEKSDAIILNISDFTTNSLFTRYITALLAKPFVILTGNSGTGKTRIAKRFAKYLERKIYGDVTNCLLVPVGADWTDNTKIMGYYNPLANNGAGEYVKTDILKFIELANANPDIPFFLILDEMNLSHVERYFSDFLSKMETPDDPFDIDHYGKVPFPKNLFVTGTVNIDETTYMFSPKVLDRANVIEFIPDKEDVLRIFSQKPEVDEIETVPEGVAENFIALARDVRNYSNGPLTDAGANLKIIFGELYDILKTAGFEFAYRTTKEIVLYYCAAHSLDPNVYTYKVIDEQIVQKILPKIHGNKKQIGNLLYKLKEFLEDNAEEDEFLLSRAKIQAMIEKLEKFQYASFI